MADTASAQTDDVVIFDGHNHMAMDIGFRRSNGEKAVFTTRYAPVMQKAGIKAVMVNVGGDNTGFTNGTDLMLWGTLWIMDMMHAEADESGDTMSLCFSGADIRKAQEDGKVAVIMGIEGGRPLEGKPDLDNLVALRSLYKLGLRHLQLVCTARNRIADGDDEPGTGGRLTRFGVAVVKEANRLGMVLDTAHLQEQGFWQVMEIATGPVVNSHSNCAAICSHPRNVNDDQLKAIAQSGGVLGLTSSSSFTSEAHRKEGYASIDQLIDHIDHVASLVGTDHISIGADFDMFEHGPSIWTPAPGWLEGHYYGLRDNTVAGFQSLEDFPNVTDGLRKRGYSSGDISKIMGGNLFRVYSAVLQ